MIIKFKHKGLKELFVKGTSAKIPPDMHKKAIMLLDMLDAANEANAMNIAGFEFHQLLGSRKSCYAVSVNKNCRIIFEWEDGAVKVNLEDYH